MASGRLRAAMLVLLVPVAISACDGDGHDGLLSTVPRFEGDVRIEARAGGVTYAVAGELRFDRGTRTIRFLRADGDLLTKVGDGPLEKSRDGTDLPLGPDDPRDFGLLLTALYSAPDPAAGIERSTTGYVVRAGDQELHVTLEPVNRD